MTNIPTDLLRTLITVVDLRSFTKAAVSLGVTQPAVSTQIKRLEFLLGGDLFDRSFQGVNLTPHGERVVGYARRLLSVNDEIAALRANGAPSELVIRVGTPSDFVASTLPDTLARSRARWSEVRFVVRTDFYEPLLRQLRAGDIDLLVGLSLAPPRGARHSQAQEIVWVRGKTTRLDPRRPVPLVSYGEPCVYHRVAVKALKAAGLDWDDVFTGPSMNSLSRAIAAGLGIMAVTRQRAQEAGLTVWEDAPLPKLPELYSGIYVREGGDRSIYEQLADDIAVAVHGEGRPKVRTISRARAASSAA